MTLATAPTSIRLKADVLFSRLLTGGGYGGLYRISNVTAFGIQPQSTTDTISGTELANYGQTLDAISEQDDLLVTLACNRFYGKNLALALLGDESEVTAGNENITGELVQLVAGEAQLGQMNVDDSTVVVRGLDLTVDDSSGFAAGSEISVAGVVFGLIAAVPDGTSIHVFQWGTAPVDGDDVTDGTNTATIASAGVAAKNDLAALTTDFTVDETNGRITVVESGTLDVAGLNKVLLNYTHSKTAGSRITIASNTIIKGRLVVKGVNVVTNKLVHVDLRQVNISPNTALSLMSANERSSIEWQGVAETPSGSNDPGWIDLGA